jgi:hypothetical protein
LATRYNEGFRAKSIGYNQDRKESLGEEILKGPCKFDYQTINPMNKLYEPFNIDACFSSG